VEFGDLWTKEADRLALGGTGGGGEASELKLWTDTEGDCGEMGKKG